MAVPVNDSTSMTEKSKLLWAQDKVSVDQTGNRSDLSSKSDYQSILDLVLKNSQKELDKNIIQNTLKSDPSIIKTEPLTPSHNTSKNIKETKRQNKLFSQNNEEVKKDKKKEAEATQENKNKMTSLVSVDPEIHFLLTNQGIEQETSLPSDLQEIKNLDTPLLEDEINEDPGVAPIPIQHTQQNVDVVRQSGSEKVKPVESAGSNLPQAPANQSQTNNKTTSQLDVNTEKNSSSDTPIQTPKTPETSLAKNFIETMTKASKIPFEELKQNLNDTPLSLTPVKPVQVKNDLFILTKNASAPTSSEGNSSTSQQNNSHTSQSHTPENGVTLPKNTRPSSSSAIKNNGHKYMFSQKVTKEISDQISVAVNREMKNNNRRISIQLKPASLGRVDIQLILSTDGMAVAKVKASNKDTLDILRRDEKGISDILRENGFKLENSGMEFELTKDNSNSDAFFAQTSDDQANTPRNMINNQELDAETENEDIIPREKSSEMDPYSDHLLNVIV